VEVLAFFNECFVVKDAEEIDNLRKSSKVTAYFFGKFIKEVELVIDSGKQTKHAELSQKVLDLMEAEPELKKCAIKLASQKVVKEYIDIGATCSVQSGGTYSPRIFNESNQKELKSDCILLGLGTMYRSYNTFIGRTLLIDPTEEQKSIYKKVETLVKVIVQNLRPGVKVCDVFKKAKQFMQDTLPAIEVPKSFGFGMGIFLSENSLAINEHNERTIHPGHSFLVSCNFH
jgi:nucleosome binding factor SPN SPT16 subunit